MKEAQTGSPMTLEHCHSLPLTFLLASKTIVTKTLLPTSQTTTKMWVQLPVMYACAG